jgi:SAM-dependent methyltransferase
VRRLLPAKWVATTCPVCNAPGAVETLGVRTQNLVGRNCALEMRLEDTLCLTCGLIYAAARPSEEALNDYYRDAHTRCSDYIDVPPDYDAARRLACIVRLVPSGGRILELGAGIGDFCSILAGAGFKASPVDPMANEIWPSGKFDAVLAYLLLEHVYNPRRFIAKAAQRLAPGGILIVEVPDFLRDPVASMVPEHLWHYAPQHLSALFADCGLATVDIERDHASRAFAFMIAARRSGVPRRHAFDANLVSEMRTAYRRTGSLVNAEEMRTRALCNDVAATNPPCIFVWGANDYATRIGERLSEIGYSKIQLIDSAASKIGTLHQGFSRPIKPPEFSGSEPEGCVILLCSPAWNGQIRTQVGASHLRKPRIIDAIKWQPSVRE